MSNPLVLVDPITYKVTEIDDANPWENYTHKFLEKVVERIKNQIKGKSDLEKLRIANDEIAGLLNSDDCEWARIPSDTKFPGFLSSLADHALATSAVGVAIAVECWNKKIEFAREYAGKQVSEFLKNRLGVIQVIRLLCLLHDSGKPSFNHEEQTRKATEDFLTHLGFGGFASEMAEIASKHHYGDDAKHPPETKLEWIVAYADKVAVHDRMFTGRILLEEGRSMRAAIQPLKWLARNVKALDVEKAQSLADALGELDETNAIPLNSPNWEIYKKIIPLDYDYMKTLDSELSKAGQKLGNEVKLALVLFEGAGIQDFITKSSAARNLVGRSSLVEVATRLAKVELERMLAPESIIYATSGSILALVPPSELDEQVEKSNRKFEEVVSKGMTLKCCKARDKCSFSLFDLKNGPEYAWRDWKKKTALSNVGRRNFGEFYTILNNTIEALGEGAKGSNVKPLSVGDICSVCFEEEALSEDKVKAVRNRLPIDEQQEYYPGAICLRVDLHRANIKDNLKIRSSRQNLLRIDFDGKVSVEAPDPKTIRSADKEEVENSPKYRIIFKIRDFLEKSLKGKEHKDLAAKLAGKEVGFNSIKTWDELGRQARDALRREPGNDSDESEEEEISDVAFIRGDGDNFGKIKSSMSNITLYRKVSKLFEDVVQNSIAEALAEVMVRQLELYTSKEAAESGDSDSKNEQLTDLSIPFDVIYYGGDEFMLVLDAAFTIIFLNAFRNAIINRLGSRKESYEKKKDENLSTFPLGVSLSVVIAPNRVPVHGTMSAIRELEERAKEVSKRRQISTSGLPLFGVDICVALQRFVTTPSDGSVDEFYGAQQFLGEKMKIFKTAWPRLGSEIFETQTSDSSQLSLVKLTRKLLVTGLRSNNVAQSVKISSQEETKLQIRYKAARMGKERRERDGYKLLAEQLVVNDPHTPSKSGTQGGGNEASIKFQHLDVADIMKIIYDDLLLLPGEND